MARTGELLSTVGIAVLEALVELEDEEPEGSSVALVAVVEFEIEDVLLAERVIQQTFTYFHPWVSSYSIERSGSTAYLVQHAQMGLPKQHPRSPTSLTPTED